MQILHLEDSALDAELIHELLRERWPEFSAVTVKTREDFEQAVRTEEFDLIVSDYSLPAYNGIEALSFARKHCPEKPFIYMSGTIGEERAIEALKNGATDYLIKDRPARLIPAIESAMEQLEQQRAKKRAEKRVRQQASLLDKAHEAICVIDAEGRITYWNASAERLYGWTADEVLGCNRREIVHQHDGDAFDAAHARVLASGEWRGEFSARNVVEEPVVIESFWNLVSDDEDHNLSILIVESDVTERKRIEAQLMQTQRLETLGLLAGGIAHDLNNVLAPILASVDLLSEIAIRPRDRDLLDTLEMSAQHGADMVRQLLAFARGKGEQRSEQAPHMLIDGVRRLVRHAMRANIEMRMEAAKDLPLVQVDATQVRQVLLNLCINARDAMPDGGVIEIRAEKEDVGSSTRSVQGEVLPGAYVRISVSDTGTGIPPEIVAKLFDPFFTTKKAGKGTGLGLANVAGIVKSHGGFVNLDSVVGRGTAFHIYLPALEPAEGAAAVGETDGHLKGNDESILVVEDDEAIRHVLELILGACNYRIFTAEDGTRALELLRDRVHRFDLVITDLNMPGVSGAELIREMRTFLDEPKLLILSGLTDDVPEDLKDVVSLGKPLTADGLLRAVRRVLDSGAALPAEGRPAARSHSSSSNGVGTENGKSRLPVA
jgi:two-component system, cell cycle sensor histidine kinase and response regulator CckA